MSSHRYPWKWWLKDLKPPEENAPTVFSTFACGGGSSMGYKRAGFRVLGNCEIDPKIAKVYERNLHPQHSYVMDLREFNTLECLPDELYHLDVLDGSPPCSTFSHSGSRHRAWGVEKRFAEGQKLQRLDDLFFVFLDTVRKLRPKVFVAENVVGLLDGKARGYVNEILKQSRKIDYDVQMFRLNAAFMGVPQKRERVFFIGNRIGCQKLKIYTEEKPITFGEVRSRQPGRPVTEKVVKLDSVRRHGETNLNNAAKKLKVPYYTTFCCDDDTVSPTLTAGGYIYRCHDMTHYTEQDMVNVSTFPQDYDFVQSKVQFITGMSVPPSMMANIAHEIRAQWLEA